MSLEVLVYISGKFPFPGADGISTQLPSLLLSGSLRLDLKLNSTNHRTSFWLWFFQALCTSPSIPVSWRCCGMLFTPCWVMLYCARLCFRNWGQEWAGRRNMTSWLTTLSARAGGLPNPQDHGKFNKALSRQGKGEWRPGPQPHPRPQVLLTWFLHGRSYKRWNTATGLWNFWTAKNGR